MSCIPKNFFPYISTFQLSDLQKGKKQNEATFLHSCYISSMRPNIWGHVDIYYLCSIWCKLRIVIQWCNHKNIWPVITNTSNNILGRNVNWAVIHVTVINGIWVYFYTFKGLTVIWFITSNLSCHPHFQVLIVVKFKMQEFPVSQKTSFITIDHPWHLSVCFASSYTVSISLLV